MNGLILNSVPSSCLVQAVRVWCCSEADPEVGWNVSRKWQADTTYAAMAAKVRLAFDDGCATQCTLA